MSTIYMDTGSLNALIQSGTWERFRRAAAQRGLQIVTTRTVLIELSRGSPPAAVREFVRNAETRLTVIIDPHLPNQSLSLDTPVWQLYT